MSQDISLFCLFSRINEFLDRLKMMAHKVARHGFLQVSDEFRGTFRKAIAKNHSFEFEIANSQGRLDHGLAS